MKIVKSIDGTIKLLFEGYIAVLIPSINEKWAVCVSCQIGCPIGCTFCYTGKFKRNLTSEEIVSQVHEAAKIIEKNPTSVIFMGMGEPMSNFKAVEESIEQIHSAFSISYKKITVSTSGINCDKLLGKKYNAAISLHTLNEETRKKIIPISPPITKVLDFINAYCKENKYGIMIEYALMKGINDSDDDLKRLFEIDWPKNVNFNLIEYNNKGDFVRSERLLDFKETIRAKGYKCFIRHSRGADIEAACGMLDVS